jgi:DNA-3-methyladenine glycosylase II
VLVSPIILNEEGFTQGVRALAERDAHLAAAVEKFGQPPLWIREPGFPTLVYIILEQQVSLASARAAYERLRQAVNPLTPGRFLTLTNAELKRIGFSRIRRLDLKKLHLLSDQDARRRLTALKGIGTWTADIYLLSALRRPDIWPIGDLALQTAVQEVKRLRNRPSPERLEKMSAPWRPYRAVAARLFWHAYLCERGQNTAPMSL